MQPSGKVARFTTMTESPSQDDALGGSALGRSIESTIIKVDRRKNPRVTAESLAYIHVEPDSGAIVLNMSDGGLCFHAVAPIFQTGAIKFWF